MKNNYRKLKFSILLQTVLVTAVTVLVGGVILNYVIDGVYNESFGRIFVKAKSDRSVLAPDRRQQDLLYDRRLFAPVCLVLLRGAVQDDPLSGPGGGRHREYCVRFHGAHPSDHGAQAHRDPAQRDQGRSARSWSRRKGRRRRTIWFFFWPTI